MCEFTKEVDPLVVYGRRSLITYILCVREHSVNAGLCLPRDIIKLLAKYYLQTEYYRSDVPNFLLSGTEKTPQFIKIIGNSATGKTSLCKYLLAGVAENNPAAVITVSSRTYEGSERGVVNPLFIRICLGNDIKIETPGNIKQCINAWVVIEDSINDGSVYEKCVNGYKKGLNIIVITRVECKFLKPIKATATYRADKFSNSTKLNIPHGYVASKLMKKYIDAAYCK